MFDRYSSMKNMDIRKNLQHPIDWQLCLKLANNKPAFAQEMLDMFIDELPAARMNIRTAYQAQDYHQLQMQVHKLHGASCYCGVPDLRNILSQFETKLKSADTSSFSELMQQLEEEIDRVLFSYSSQDFK